MTSLNGLENLITIGDGISIFSNPELSNLIALQNLTSISPTGPYGYLEVYYNNTLTALAGLENIAAGSVNDLYIENNPVLSTCDVQSICDYLAAPNGTVSIMNNAPGCNSSGEVLEACWSNTEEKTATTGEIMILPNPATDKIYIVNPRGLKIKELMIVTTTGVTAYQQREPASETDISGLCRGMYFVRVVLEKKTETMKLIVE